MVRIAFVTSSGGLVRHASRHITADDLLCADALELRGVRAEGTVWDDPDVPWEEYDLVVIRSCWDYYRRYKDFLDWVTRMEGKGVPLQNPPDLVRWNSHKSYLGKLAAQGIPIIPSLFVESTEHRPWSELLAEVDWTDIVLKPAISIGGEGVQRVSREQLFQTQATARAQDLVVQPFCSSVQEEGEWSTIYISGVFSHAVLKRPARGNFLVQERHGGVHAAAEAPATLRQLGEQILSLFRPAPLYARIDGVRVGGGAQLSELELIEPSLYLSHHPTAGTNFATAICNLVVCKS